MPISEESTLICEKNYNNVEIPVFPDFSFIIH
jgi:hypothetical protein